MLYNARSRAIVLPMILVKGRQVIRRVMLELPYRKRRECREHDSLNITAWPLVAVALNGAFLVTGYQFGSL